MSTTKREPKTARKAGDIDRALGERLRKLRKERELSQGAFGEIVGLSQSTISSLELGDTVWTYAVGLQITRRLGIPASELEIALSSAA